MPVERFGFTFKDDSTKSQAIVERDQHALSPSYTRSYGLVVDHGKGAELWDVEGARYIDFASGIAVLATGFSHPRIVNVIKEQAERMVHIGGTDFFYEEQVMLAEKLQKIVPIHHADSPEDKLVYFGNSGTEAIEAAIKLARYRGGDNGRRKYVIAFYGSFHGRTYGALSLTASKAIQRADYAYIPDGVVHIPYVGKFAYDRSPNQTSVENHPDCFLKQFVFKKIDPAEVAAIVVEPIQGEGGYIVPADHFLKSIRDICDEHGILMIADEIQAGMGRTGRWCAMEHWDIKPDIVCMAKGLGSGVPIGAIIAHKNVMSRWVPGAHASTFGGNLLACRVAAETIDIIEDENLLDNAATLGAHALTRLNDMQAKYPVIKRVDGKGFMIGVEFATPDGAPLPAMRDKIVDQAFLNGLVMLACGKSTIRVAPALVINKEILDEGLDLFERSIAEILEAEAVDPI